MLIVVSEVYIDYAFRICSIFIPLRKRSSSPTVLKPVEWSQQAFTDENSWTPRPLIIVSPWLYDIQLPLDFAFQLIIVL